MRAATSALIAGLAYAFAAATLAAVNPIDKKADPPPKTNTDTCVFFRTVYDWRALDNRHLVLWAPGNNDPYLVETMMPLQDLMFADSLAFVDGNHDGQLCSYGMDEIIVPNSNIPQHASITSLTRLDAAGLTALSQKYHVKLDRKKKTDQDKTGAPAAAPVPDPAPTSPTDGASAPTA